MCHGRAVTWKDIEKRVLKCMCQYIIDWFIGCIQTVFLFVLCFVI